MICLAIFSFGGSGHRRFTPSLSSLFVQLSLCPSDVFSLKISHIFAYVNFLLYLCTEIGGVNLQLAV